MFVNPDKYIREAYITAITSVTGLPAYDSGIPIDVDPLPSKYFLVGSQTKNRFGISKCGHEWMCSTQVQAISVNEKGFNSMAAVDDMVQGVINAAPVIVVAGFDLKMTRFVDDPVSNIETLTNTINRKIVMHEHWLNNLTT